jgi:protein O-mannosyl-transferase
VPAPAPLESPLKQKALIHGDDWYSIGGLALIGVALLIVYRPAIAGGFIWDDEAHVTSQDLQSWQGLSRIWLDVRATQQYYPLLHSTFWIEHKIWGDSTVAYHRMNLLWHMLATSLVYVVLRRLQSSGALLAAGIFALHPVQVESVAWISEQKNTLSAVFYLCAFLAYLSFQETRSKRLYALASLCFIFALLTKTVTATLPVALLVITWWQHGRLSWRRDVLPLLPWLVLGAIAGLVTSSLEQTVIGAGSAVPHLTFTQRILIAGRAPWFYLSKLFCPSNLVFIYPRWQIDPSDWRQWVFLAASLAGLVGLWLIRRRWRAPLAAAMFFIVTLSPCLGFVNIYPFVYSFVADHFQYLACLGVFVPLAWALTCLSTQSAGPVRLAAMSMALALLPILAALTWRQSKMYADRVTLYQTTIERNPGCWMAYNNLGRQLADRGELDEAVRLYQQSVYLKPDNVEALNNLGNALSKQGRVEDAIDTYKHILAIRPQFPEARNNLGLALLSTNQPRQAIEQFAEALRLKPSFPEAQFNLGNALLMAEDPQQAIDHYQQAVSLRPNYAEAWANMAGAYAQVSRWTQSMQAAEKALELARSQGKSVLVEQIQAWLQTNGDPSSDVESHMPAVSPKP